MNISLDDLLNAIDHAIGQPNAHLAISFAKDAIVRFKALPPEKTDGQKAQIFADGLRPLVEPFLPATGPLAPVLAILAFAEPFLGKAVDAIEKAAAKQVEGVDDQDGPPVEMAASNG